MIQISFDPLDYETATAAKVARDTHWRELRAAGRLVKRWVLPDQRRSYSGFGQADGRVRDIYYISVYP